MLPLTELERLYRDRVPILQDTARELESFIADAFEGLKRVDSIKTRVKTVESFMVKASKQSDGVARYRAPLDEIQDQIGCRVVVFFKSDLLLAERLVLESLSRIEIDRKQPEEPRSFEYEAIHFICHIPNAMKQQLGTPIDFFELQIKTLFQHAWAQAYHDIGYKAPSAIDLKDDRLMHFALATAWGADEIFDQIWNKYNRE